jgi:RNA polymerase sigma-70 factor (ECF subfamily)
MLDNPLEEIWNAYCCRLLAFIRRRVADETEAEDLLQEVFLRVHRSLCCQPDWQKPAGWFYQIARNLIIDHYRQRREWEEIPEDLPDGAPPVSSLLEDNPEAELALSLREMVAALPEPYRQALVLTEYEGVSQKELAARLGLSPTGARSRVQRARAMLRDLLLACCHIELDRRGRVLDVYPHCCCCNPGVPERSGRTPHLPAGA